jgi:competence protein ComEC
MRVDVVLVVAAAAMLGGLVVVAPLAVAAFVVVAVYLLRRAVGVRCVLAAAVVLLLQASRAAHGVPAFERSLEGVRVQLGAPRRCTGVGVVETSPALRAGSLGYVAAFDVLDCEGRAVGPAHVRLYDGPPALARGDRVEVVAQLAPAELFRNADLPDPTFAAARSAVALSGAALSTRIVRRSWGLPALIDRARRCARAGIDATFAPAAAPMARALVLGENDLSDDDSAAFRASGLAHLLAVSGTHLVFAVLGVVHAVAFVLVRIQALSASRDVGRIAAALGALLAPLYADFAGGSGSAWRAAFMLTVALGARALGQRPVATRSFALSLAVGAALDPVVALDVSFMLSASATAGLLCLGQPLTQRFAPPTSGQLRRAVATSVIATVSAMVPCTPLLALLGGGLTLAGVVANVIAVPFGEVVSLPLCLVHAIVPPGLLSRGIADVASGALLVVRWLARASASVTWLSVPVPPPTAAHFIVLGVSVLAAFCVPSRRAAVAIGALLSLATVEVRVRRSGSPTGVLRMTVLDVGQGDAALVDLPDGKLMLVDGGGFVGSPVDPGLRVILPVLRARRRSRIDVAVLTHPHPDHFLGLATTLRSVDVGELWDTGQGRAQGAGAQYASMLADLARRHNPVRGPDELCGPERVLGGAGVQVLAPCPSFDPALGANDNSFVIRLRHGARTILLTGDAEGLEEARLLSLGGALHADVLKVAHHGSRTSSGSELLAAVRPHFATVSCGVRNRFGHPFPGTLLALEQAGARVLRTDLVGSIELVTDGTAVRARVFGRDFGERLSASLW